jgi:hypothetical protein
MAEKLTLNNYLVWKAVIMPAVRGAHLVGYLDGTILALVEELAMEKDVSSKTVTTMEENPAFVAWNEKDRQVLSYPFGSMSREVLIQLTDHQTAQASWKVIQDMFSSQSRVRIIHLRRTLSDLKKGMIVPQCTSEN